MKRYNCHITCTDVEPKTWNESLLTVKTDIKGFQNTRKKIAEKIIENLAILKIESQEIQNECFRILQGILYKISIKLRNKPHSCIAYAIIVLAARKHNFPLTLKKIQKLSKYRSKLLFRSLS